MIPTEESAPTLTPRQRGLLSRAFARASRTSPKSGKATRLACFAFVLVLLAGPLSMGVAGASGAYEKAAAAPPSSITLALNPSGNGQTIGTGSTIVLNGVAIIFVGYYVWTGLWEPAVAGSQVFGAGLALEMYGLSPKNSTLDVGLFINGHFVDNTSIEINLEQQPTITLPFTPTTSWTRVVLYIDNVPEWSASFAVPLSLIPLAGYDIGGLDLLVLAGLSLVLLSFTAMTMTARRLMRRVLAAPKFSLLIWGHVIIIAIGGMVLANFQIVNSIFAGWSTLIYPIFLAPVWFFAMLSYFNKTKGTEILQLLARAEGRVGWRRWIVYIGKTTDGKTVLMFPDWKDFWARAFGHFIVVDEEDTMKPPRFVSDAQRAYIRPAPKPRKTPNEWPIVNSQEDMVEQIMWTLSDVPIKTVRPRLTIHKRKTIPAKIDRQGMTIPAHDEMRLSLPHYEEGHAEWNLAPESFAAAAAVMARWASARDLAEAYSKIKTELSVLKGFFSRRVEEEVAARLTALESALGETERSLSPEEAKALIDETRVRRDEDRQRKNRDKDVEL